MTTTHAPKCTRPGCYHYASHGERGRCSHVNCPCRKVVTAQLVGNSTCMTEVGCVRRVPSVRTDRAYD